MPSSKRLNTQYILIQLAYWAVCAALLAYQTTLLLHRGFTNTQVGVLLAVRCFAGVVAQPLVGSYADRHPNLPLKYILTLCLGVAFFAGLLHMLPMGMVGTAAVLVFLGALEISAYPLVDSMAVQFIQVGANVPYSLGRGLGSLAYAATSMFIGFQAGRLGVETTLVTHSVLVLVLMAAVVTFPKFDPEWRRKDGEKTAAQAPKNALRLLRDNPRFALMLVGLLLGITACLPMSNFCINIIRAKGGTDAHLGVAIFLMSGSELPAALLFDRLYRKGRAGAILTFSMAAVAVKAFLTILAPNYWMVWLLQPAQMLGYGLFTPASVFYVSDAIAPEDQVKGQTLMMMASNGLGGMLGSALGGRMLDMGGVSGMLWVCVAMGTAAALLTAFAAFPRLRRKGGV